MAQTILKMMRKSCQADHQFVHVEASDFSHLSLAFYDRMQANLEQLGFKLLADIEDVKIRNMSPKSRTLMRLMVSSDRTVLAAIYHFKPSLLWRVLLWFMRMRVKYVVEFQSQLDGGDHILTTTISEKDLFPRSPQLHRFCEPEGTGPQTLYAQHREFLNQVIDEVGILPLAVNSMEEACAMENEQRRIQQRYLQSIGWVTMEYLINQHNGDRATASEVYRAVQQILAEEAMLDSEPVMDIDSADELPD
jgi:hypothetical protein